MQGVKERSKAMKEAIKHATMIVAYSIFVMIVLTSPLWAEL